MDSGDFMSILGWIVIGIIAGNVVFFTPLIARHIWEEKHEKH